MKNRWLKRLKKGLKERDNIFALFFGPALLGTFLNIFTAIFAKDHIPFFIISCYVIAFIAIFSIFLGAEVFTNRSSYDDEIDREEKAKELKEKQKLQSLEKERLETFFSLKRLSMDMGEEHADIKKPLQLLVVTIEHIKEKYPVDTKEDHYLTRSLPNGIEKIIRNYLQLTVENQMEMKPTIVKMLNENQVKLENNFIHKRQDDLKKEIAKQIEFVETIID